MTIAGRQTNITLTNTDKFFKKKVEVNTMFIKFKNFKNVPKKVVVAYIINVILILSGCFLLAADIFNISFPFNAYIPAMICIIIANFINIVVLNKYRDILRG